MVDKLKKPDEEDEQRPKMVDKLKKPDEEDEQRPKMVDKLKKPDEEDENDYINIKVVSQKQAGSEMFFRIKRTTILKKLMTNYCHRQSLKLDTIVFLHNGYRIRGDQTPEQLRMEENDTIDAMVHQFGGSGV